MAGEFLVTLGNEESILTAFNGDYLKGHAQPRMAMVGRSNVGKSSLINAIIGNRLARVSNQPGKTRLIHFYLWKETNKIIADLPGYGFAKAGHEERNRWAQFIQTYLKTDQNLQRAIVLLDARHGPTALDEQAIDFLSSSKIPVTFVFTKLDALKTQKERAARFKEAIVALKRIGFNGNQDDLIWVSAHSQDGLKRLTSVLKDL